jgi:hypothetical protein
MTTDTMAELERLVDGYGIAAGYHFATRQGASDKSTARTALLDAIAKLVQGCADLKQELAREKFEQHQNQLDLIERLNELCASEAKLAQECGRWEEVAHHLRHCVECGETDVENCYDGKPLWDAALASSTRVSDGEDQK